jgi:uncharacterized membrane protein
MSKFLHDAKPISFKELKKKHKPITDVNQKHEDSLSKLEKFSVLISDRVGTPGFFLIIIVWTILWLTWNLLAPKNLQFDPPMSFVFWLFVSNLIQIFLMPLIMVAQNLQNRHADMRAENDYQINLKAEQEIEVILHHLEYQNAILISLVEKMGINQEEILKTIQHHVKETEKKFSAETGNPK